MELENKILIIGGYGEKNFGDDLLMLIIADLLKDIGLIQKSVFVFHRRDNYHIFLNKDIKIDFVDNIDFKDFNIVIYGGGTQFFSFDGNLKFLLEAFFKIVKKGNWEKISRFLGLGRSKYNPDVIEYYIGIGLGPFKNIFYPYLLKQKLKGYNKFFYFRDEISFKYAQKFGIENKILGSDLCYSYLGKKYFLNKKKYFNNTNIKIGVILRDWENDSFKEKFAVNIFKNEEKLYKKFNCQLEYIIYRPYDKRTINLLRKFNKNFLCWDPATISVEKFISFHLKYDIIITARFHGAVVSTLLGIPTIGIGIEPKLNQVLKSYFGDNFFVWNKPYKIKDLENILSMLIDKNLKKISHNLSIITNKLEKKANFMIEKFIMDLKR